MTQSENAPGAPENAQPFVVGLQPRIVPFPLS